MSVPKVIGLTHTPESTNHGLIEAPGVMLDRNKYAVLWVHGNRLKPGSYSEML